MVDHVQEDGQAPQGHGEEKEAIFEGTAMLSGDAAEAVSAGLPSLRASGFALQAVSKAKPREIESPERTIHFIMLSSVPRISN